MAIYPVIHRIDGLRELEANLKILREQFGVRTGGVILRGLSAGARLIRDEAKRRVPNIPAGYLSEFVTKEVRRGKNKGKKITKRNTPAFRKALLRNNIIEHKIPVSAPLSEGRPTVLVRVRNAGYYRVNGRIRFRYPGSSPGWWWWIEFGTAKQPAQPFLRPAFEAQKVAALETFKKTVAAEIDALFAKNFRRAA
jgi:HK97 gp10 family phage protein